MRAPTKTPSRLVRSSMAKPRYSPRSVMRRRKSARPFRAAENAKTEDAATMAKPDDAVFASTQMALALPASP